MNVRAASLLPWLLLSPLATLSSQLPGCWVRGDPAEAASRASPLDSSVVTLGDGALKVCFGSPSAHGRTMVGGVERWGEPWRMGANEATSLHVGVPVVVAGVALAPGSYSVYAIPEPGAWTVVLNRAWRRWGIPISAEVRSQDVGEAVIVPERLDQPVERLRFRFGPPAAAGVDLIMEWERNRLTIPIRRAG